jgi:hypothetical protein
MSQPKRQVRTLHERLKIAEEVEKNPGEKLVDIAKRLGLAPSTLNSTFAKKDKIREQTEKCDNASKKRKTGRELTFAKLKSVLFTWYQHARASNIPVDGTILRGKAMMIAAQLNIENFTRDIYNTDETGLFYNVLPERTLALKGESCNGGKNSKDRLTVLLCVNSDGSDKQVPIVIGKSLKPQCLKNVKNYPPNTT